MALDEVLLVVAAKKQKTKTKEKNLTLLCVGHLLLEGRVFHVLGFCPFHWFLCGLLPSFDISFVLPYLNLSFPFLCQH